MSAKNRPLISFDWAIKNMLRNKANYDILEGFLSVLLKQDIRILSILESEGNQEYPTDKFNRVDLVVEDENKEIIIVEVQNNREVHYFARLLYGASKLIVDHIQVGESFEKVRKVISISILYFLLGEGESDYVYHGRTEFYGLNDHSKLDLKRHDKNALLGMSERLDGNIFPEYYLIELERFRNVVKSDLDEWVYFFKNSEIKQEFRSKNIQKAREKLDLLQMPENERKAYEKYLLNKASEQGMFEAAKIEEKIEIAKAMLVEGMPVALISKVTGLAEAEILKLK